MHSYRKIAFAAICCFVFASVSNAALPAGYAGTPFSFDTLKGHPQGVPGVVKAVFFDNGGEGVAFHYPGGNQGGSMRLNAANQQIQADFAVSMQSYSGNDWDVVGYGTNDQHDSSVNAAITTWHLSWIDAASPTDPGEWLKYTIHVNTAGTYYISWKQATANANGIQTLTFYSGASAKTDSIKNIPVCITPPGCPEVWHAWTVNNNIDSVALDTGLQVIKLAFISGSWNFDWMRFTLKNASGVYEPVNAKSAENSMNLRAAIANGRLALSYNATGGSATRISLMNCAGKTVVSSLDNATTRGTRTAALDVRSLRRGVYFVNVEHNGVTQVKSFTVTQ